MLSWFCLFAGVIFGISLQFYSVMQINSLLVTSGGCLKLLTLSKWKYKYNYQNYQYNHEYKYKWCTRCARMWYYLRWRWPGNQQLIMQFLVIIYFLYFATTTTTTLATKERGTCTWTSAAQWVQNIFTSASDYCIAIPAIILNSSCQSLPIAARAEVCSNFYLFAATFVCLKQWHLFVCSSIY